MKNEERLLLHTSAKNRKEVLTRINYVSKIHFRVVTKYISRYHVGKIRQIANTPKGGLIIIYENQYGLNTVVFEDQVLLSKLNELVCNFHRLTML